MSTPISVERVSTPDAPIPGGKRTLLRASDGRYFIASYIPSAPDHGGPETLVFPSDANGEIIKWREVAGGRGLSMEEAIANLGEVLNDGQPQTHEYTLPDVFDAIGVVFGVNDDVFNVFVDDDEEEL